MFTFGHIYIEFNDALYSLCAYTLCFYHTNTYTYIYIYTYITVYLIETTQTHDT